MGRTITEKIFMRAAGLNETPEISQGYDLKIDFAFGNEVTLPLAIDQIVKNNAERLIGKVLPTDRMAFVLDHFIPAPTIDAAEAEKMVRGFAAQHNIPVYTGAKHGIEHAFLPEAGLVLPGDIVVGADSHTCTYGALGAFSFGIGSTALAAALISGEITSKFPEQWLFKLYGTMQEWVGGKDLILYIIGQIGVKGATGKTMEFAGGAVGELSMDARLTMANMGIEAGATNAIFNPDINTEHYVRRAKRSFHPERSDPDASYAKTLPIDISTIEPQVAYPSLPEKAVPISRASRDNITIDQVVIGSCTNGRYSDFAEAAKVLKGRKLHPDVKGMAIPGTRETYLELLRTGIIEIFVDAGFNVSTPTCGPCLGAYYGLLAEGERVVSTTNRNFVGRMGSPKAEVYLAGPAVAAASGIVGRIAHPREVL